MMATVWQPDLLRTLQIGGCTVILAGAPAHLTVESESLANKASRCSSGRSPALPIPRTCVGGDRFASDARCQEQEQEQEQLWQNFFLEPTMWWDARRDKRSSRSPDFRRKGSGEVLWLNSIFKPAWVDDQLVSLDMLRGNVASPSQSRSADKSELCDPAGSEMDVVTAGTVMTLCQQGKLSEAVELGEVVEGLELLVDRGCQVTDSVLYLVLKKCTARRDLVLARRVHHLVVRCGHESNAFLANHVMGMYASDGRLEDVVQVFRKVAVPDVYMWSSIILAHARHGQPTQAIDLYRQMREASVKPDNHIFVAVLKACAAAEDLVSGKEVHVDIQASAVKADLFVGNSLVNMYAKCGSVDNARKVFDSLSRRCVVTWNTMIAGYTRQGRGREALALYACMEREGITRADHVTFVCLLSACASVGALQEGKQLHSQVRERGLEGDVRIGNCLVDMYAKCGSLETACRIFNSLRRRDVVSWNAMITGYMQQGLGEDALALYSGMQREGVTPASHVTFACLLQACVSVGNLQQGKQLHLQIRERGLEADAFIGSCLVNMYAKCGSVHDARQVFDNLPWKDVVTWTAMIGGYTQQGLGREALALYASMQHEGITPDDHVAFVCLVQACASVGAVQQGKQLHTQIRELGLEQDIRIGNCLVDMYAKFGSLEDACNVFNRLPSRDVVSWNAMLNGYAEHGNCEMAMRCFHNMLEQGIRPTERTFVCLLVACSHAGLVQEGQRIFKQMVDDHNMVPSDYHYNCLVDLLARSGRLDEAEHLLRTVTMANTVVGWTALLSACKTHHDIERGIRCFDHLTSSEADDASSYVLLGTIYANANRWDDVRKLESLRKSAGAKKKAAKACIEVQHKVHEFTVGEDRPESSKLKTIITRMKEEGGHIPHTALILKAISEKEKEDSLCGHAEKLALAYGILNTPSGTSLMVTKNLRMCGDCHSSTKLMSRLEKREIIVRDVHRVHRFLDGVCSCGDRH